MWIQKPIQNLAAVVCQATDYRNFINSTTFDRSCQIIQENCEEGLWWVSETSLFQGAENECNKVEKHGPGQRISMQEGRVPV